MPTLQVRFLGTLDIRADDRLLPKPPTLKSQSLLAYLVCHRHRPQPRDRLAGLFWGDRPEPKARHSLATALWHVRRCLPHENYILSDSHTVQFDPQGDLWLDVDHFESGTAHKDDSQLESAVALYRGEFLEGFYDDWIINERYRLEMLYSDALARLMACHEASGQIQAALTVAHRLLQHDPVREDAHRLAMRAYCRLGQRNAALAQFHLCQDTVHEHLGTAPMVETRELNRLILEGRFESSSSPGIGGAPVSEAVRPVPVGHDPLDAIARCRLVGRERELRFLQQYWHRAQTGQGGNVFIRGEAGVGKTRLVEELAGHVRWQGRRVLWGRCYEFERLLPYQPISEALRTVLPTLAPDELASLGPWTLAEVARLVPGMADLSRDLEVVVSTDPSQDRASLFEGVAQFFNRLSSCEGLLVVIEDLQWASDSTLQMLHYLARNLAVHPILILGTLRSEAVSGRRALRSLQRELCRDGLAQVLRLTRLSPESVEAIVVEMSGAGEAVAPLAGRLYQETEGNPFFLMELVRALFEADLIQLEAGLWRGDFGQLCQRALPLPASLSEAVLARVESLDKDEQQVLQLAAVLGREFDFDLVTALWGRGEEATLEALEVLLRRRLLEEGWGSMGRDYAFSHHKIQEVVYAGLSRQRRQHAHARAGATMENLYDVAGRKELAGELAYHFEQGWELDKALMEKAITYLLHAGDLARGMYAHGEAIDYYRRALVPLKKQEDFGRTARTLMKLGLTYHTAFDFERGRVAFDKGFALWQRAALMEHNTPPPPAPHALRTHGENPATLDPGLAEDLPSVDLIRQLFCGLTDLTPEMDVVPDIAHSWEVLDGGSNYRFHLRRDVRWSDRAPVTAHDFEYAWKRALDPATGSVVADLLYDVRGARAFHQGEAFDPDRLGVKALDEVTLAVELEGPTGYFLHLLANPITWPVPRHTIRKLGERWFEPENIVTNGPFRLEAWNPGTSFILSSSPSYHGRLGGNVERVELSLMPVNETHVALEMYEAGELDILDLGRLHPAKMEPARQGFPGEYVQVPRLATCYVGFNMRRPPFDDVRVRRAFAQATDRGMLANVVMKGYESPATGGFVPPGMPGHSPGIGLPYDPERARQLLACAGYPGGRGFPVVEAMAPAAYGPHARYLQARWKDELGAEIRWEIMEVMTVDRLLNRARHIFAWWWVADYPDPDNFLRVSTIPWWIGWDNAESQGLVEQARRVTDQHERMKLYGRAERILMEEARVLPLTYQPGHLLVKPWVSGYPTSAMGTRYWKDSIIDPH